MYTDTHAHACHRTRVDVRGQRSRVSSLLFCGSWGSNSAFQAWKQVSFTTKPSHQPQALDLINVRGIKNYGDFGS